ncbi:MAG: GNAT family N-acetyltransferase [Pseudomonadales bacterium]|nr:GNAT family N-acetyltransferase [Pseudomonadales bacterium]
MTSLQTERLSSDRWAVYRALRLAALEDAPDAFGSTHADACRLTDAEWQARLTGLLPERDLPLVAVVDGVPGGLAWGRMDTGESRSAHLYQMWVAPAFRGRGAGRVLVATVIDWARSIGAERILLSVTCGDTPARRLYESAGFRPDGEPEPIRPGADLLAQPLRLDLRTGDRRG